MIYEHICRTADGRYCKQAHV